MPIWLIIGLMAVAAGIVVLAVKMVAVVAGAARRKRRGTTTTGVVVSVETRRASESDGTWTVFYPTVEFAGLGGPLRFQNGKPVAHCPAPGSPVTVWYDPDDPAARPEVVVGTIRNSILIYTVFIVLMTLVALFALWFNAQWQGSVR